MIWRIAGLAFYLAPFLVGLGRWRRDPESAASPQFIFFVNLLLGWTGIGWLVAWWLAFRRTTLPTLPRGGWVGPLPDRPIWDGDPDTVTPPPSSPGRDWNQPNTFGGFEPSLPRPVCPTCQGTGQMPCPGCPNGMVWVGPTTATGSGHWDRHSFCNGSGKVQCNGPGPHGW